MPDLTQEDIESLPALRTFSSTCSALTWKWDGSDMWVHVGYCGGWDKSAFPSPEELLDGAVIETTPPPPSTAREVLDIIDAFLVDHTGPEIHASEARKLWAVLSALRGPDDVNRDDLKHYATIPIRRAAFPRLAKSVDAGGGPWRCGLPCLLGASDHYFLPPRGGDKESGHFRTHAVDAAAALKLIPRLLPS